MAQFTTAERVNAAFKQVFRILGSSNTDDAMGKRWYEELYTSIGTILPRHYWADAAEITFCSTLLQARALAAAKPAVVEDRSQLASIITLTLDMTSNGRPWIARDTPGDENSAIIGDWIQPNDYPDAAGQPSNGFSCVLYDGTGAVITATEGAWVPSYPLGAIVLGNGQAVGQGELAAYVAPLKVGVFRYVGLKGSGAVAAPASESFVRDEDPLIVVDGQTDFDLDWSSAADSLEVSLNGILRTAGVDYTLVGRHVTWLDPFNADQGVNVTLKTTDWLNFWYVNGAARRGLTQHFPLPILAPGQTLFTLPTAPLQNQHLQLYLNGQRCRQGAGAWYTVTGTTILWLNPVVFFAPGGLTLSLTDQITAAYIETADLGESTVKRPLIPVLIDGQTIFNVPIPDDLMSAKLYINGQFQTLGTDWIWFAPTQIQWLDPINPSTGLPITLVTTDEVQFIADNVGARCCGAQRFTELEDAPADYVGHAGDVPTVSPAEDALEFVTPTVYAKYFLDLNDTPADYLGHAGELVRVNAGEVALEFVPAVNFKVRALIDPSGGGDYLAIGDALLSGVEKMELKPGKTFAERVLIDRSDVDILGYPNSIVVPPPGQTEAFLLDGSGGTLERLRFAGFKVQMNATHPESFCGFRSITGNLRDVKFKEMLLVGYHYYPVLPIDASCGIAFANTPALIEDVEVASTLFQDWEYSCFTMWGNGGIRDVRVHSCLLKDYMTFGMDWYNGVSEVMINNNNFRTIYTTETPVVIPPLVPGAKSLFINGTNHHITFQNNTFFGGGKTGGCAILISSHAGQPADVNIECNTIRNFLYAIGMNGVGPGIGRVRIVGNANDEASDNADGLILFGVGTYFIGHNTVDV